MVIIESMVSDSTGLLNLIDGVLSLTREDFSNYYGHPVSTGKLPADVVAEAESNIFGSLDVFKNGTPPSYPHRKLDIFLKNTFGTGTIP